MELGIFGQWNDMGASYYTTFPISQTTALQTLSSLGSTTGIRTSSDGAESRSTSYRSSVLFNATSGNSEYLTSIFYASSSSERTQLPFFTFPATTITSSGSTYTSSTSSTLNSTSSTVNVAYSSFVGTYSQTLTGTADTTTTELYSTVGSNTYSYQQITTYYNSTKEYTVKSASEVPATYTYGINQRNRQASHISGTIATSGETFTFFSLSDVTLGHFDSDQITSLSNYYTTNSVSGHNTIVCGLLEYTEPIGASAMSSSNDSSTLIVSTNNLGTITTTTQNRVTNANTYLAGTTSRLAGTCISTILSYYIMTLPLYVKNASTTTSYTYQSVEDYRRTVSSTKTVFEPNFTESTTSNVTIGFLSGVASNWETTSNLITAPTFISSIGLSIGFISGVTRGEVNQGGFFGLNQNVPSNNAGTTVTGDTTKYSIYNGLHESRSVVGPLIGDTSWDSSIAGAVGSVTEEFTASDGAGVGLLNNSHFFISRRGRLTLETLSTGDVTNKTTTVTDLDGGIILSANDKVVNIFPNSYYSLTYNFYNPD